MPRVTNGIKPNISVIIDVEPHFKSYHHHQPIKNMTNSSYLWQANQDLSEACLQHPFVRGIADGSLPQNSFAYYVAQDAFFLGTFARAYSIAAARFDSSGDDSLLAVVCFFGTAVS